MGLKEDLDFCLNNGKCTECAYGNAQSMLICRPLIEKVLKEQKAIYQQCLYKDITGKEPPMDEKCLKKCSEKICKYCVEIMMKDNGL